MPATIHSDEYARLIGLLRHYRKRAGLRQIDLAQRLGKPQCFVSKYEVAERRLDIVELDAICTALGVSVVTVVKGWGDGRTAD